MSRETAIHNGKLTSDLDANGFRILNAQGGGGGGGSGGGAVSSVNGKTGEVVLDASDIRRDAGEEGTIQDALGDIEIALGEKVDTDDSRLTNARTPTAHTHTQDQITDFGGPYLPTSGGNVGSINVTEADSGGVLNVVGYGSGGVINVNSGGGGGGGGTINVGADSDGGGLIDVKGEFASIKKDGKEVATEDQLPYASTSTPADRTCSTVTVASTGASVTIPKPSTDSKVTAFCVYLDMTALTGTAPTVGFKYSDNTDADILTRGGEGLSYETGAVNAVFFIQCGTKYIASAQVYKEASNG